MTRKTWRSLYLALLAMVVVAESGCSTNPATGESSFTGLMSESDEQSIGRENHPKILEEFGGAYPDQQVQHMSPASATSWRAPRTGPTSASPSPFWIRRS